MPHVFRKATMSDVPAMLAIIEDGKAFLRRQGVDQWQKGAPNRAMLEDDVTRGEAYVLCQGSAVLATLALLFREEADYAVLTSGAWGSDAPYAALHRVALSAGTRGSGLAAELMQAIKAHCRQNGFYSIRIDTHSQNRPMQRYLEKNGFTHRGSIVLGSGPEKGQPRIVLDCQLASSETHRP